MDARGGPAPTGIFRGLTIRARVAAVLAVSETVLPLVARNPAWRSVAESAVRAGWDWAEGREVAGDVFNDYFHDRSDQGINIYADESTGDEETGWMVLGNAVLYVGWHAYRAAGADAIPQTIDEVDEGEAVEVMDHWAKSPAYDPDFLNALSSYLHQHFGATDDDELGGPVRRDEVVMNRNPRRR